MYIYICVCVCVCVHRLIIYKYNMISKCNILSDPIHVYIFVLLIMDKLV